MLEATKNTTEYIYLANFNNLWDVLRDSERSPLESLDKATWSSIYPIVIRRRRILGRSHAEPDAEEGASKVGANGEEAVPKPRSPVCRSKFLDGESGRSHSTPFEGATRSQEEQCKYAMARGLLLKNRSLWRMQML